MFVFELQDRNGRARVSGGKHLKSTENYPWGFACKVGG